MSHPIELRVFLAPEDRGASLQRDVLNGLFSLPKSLSPMWFYDDRGSALFDEITRLPEYYPTRAEMEILRRHAAEIVALSSADVLVELGSGTSEKTRLLLSAMQAESRLSHFVPFDVSESTLAEAARAIYAGYGIPVTAIVGDFERHLEQIPSHGSSRMIAFLGSTIGNLDRSNRQRFFADLESMMRQDDWLLLGTDLVKDTARLIAAYDDAAGVTAEFNRNVLEVLNKEMNSDFEPKLFDHIALWNETDARIEMRLRSRTAQTISFPTLGASVHFQEDEELLTEISSKFTADAVEDELTEAHLVVEASWTDSAGDFLLTLARPGR